ncbi:MAG: ATP-grasp domain-containing protein [Nitrososphaerales archaeon]
MRLFEYQGKELFRKYGIQVPASALVRGLGELDGALAAVGLPAVVKAQVLAGGRGKAGGVAVVGSKEEARKEAARILGLSIAGERPSGLLVERATARLEEMYLSVALDRGKRCFVVIGARVGGVDVESMEGKVFEPVPVSGLQDAQARSVAFRMNVQGDLLAPFLRVLTSLERLSREEECELVEVNPLALTLDGSLVALDSKVILDDNALFRHPEFSQLAPEDPLEGEAAKQGFAFVRLEGDLAVVGNGAGLVLSTLDLVADAGGAAACFLDLGGGSQRERVEAALRLVRRLPNVKRVLVNIFGGITRTTDVAAGLRNVVAEGGMPPVFARISGAEEAQARSMLEGTPVRLFASAQEAVAAAVLAVGGGGA